GSVPSPARSGAEDHTPGRSDIEGELGADLDAGVAADWNLAGDFQRLFHVAGFNEHEAAEDLFGLREGAVGDHALAAASANRARRRGALEGGGGDEKSAPGQLGVIGAGLPIQGRLLFGTEAAQRAGVEI